MILQNMWKESKILSKKWVPAIMAKIDIFIITSSQNTALTICNLFKEM